MTAAAARYACDASPMMRSRLARVALAPVLGALFACAPSGSAPEEAPEQDRMAAYVGGWDGAATQGSSVLLLREGLTGTLSAARLVGAEFEYQVTYEVEGEPDETSSDVMLGLGCAEIRMRPIAAETPDEPDPDPSSEPAAEDTWASLDCAGWELDLQCGLAGECGVGDCNMLCDVVFFGDAYATATVTLSVVEDEFDHWQRV